MSDYLVEHATILGLMLVYLVFCLGVGWYFRNRAAAGVKAFYVAKREIPGWVVSLAFFSTFASTNTYIGQAGKSFQYGLSWAWVGFIWAIFCVISWLVLGPRMRNQTALLGSYTVPDYFHLRYKSSLSKSIRILSAIIILFATLWYMVGITKGLGHVLTAVLDVPYALGHGADDHHHRRVHHLGRHVRRVMDRCRPGDHDVRGGGHSRYVAVYPCRRCG